AVRGVRERRRADAGRRLRSRGPGAPLLPPARAGRPAGLAALDEHLPGRRRDVPEERQHRRRLRVRRAPQGGRRPAYRAAGVIHSTFRPRVFLSRRVPDRVRGELARRFDLDVHESEQPPARDELLARALGAVGLVTMLTDRVDDELLDAAGPQLRVVANHAVGFDNVDLPAATRRRILVANTPDVLTEATAELTIALILDLVRRVSEGDRFLRRGERWVWAPTFMLGAGLRGRTLGIVGLGRNGSEMALLASALGI